MNILVLNGPNLNMLGVREPEIYGSNTYEDLEQYIQDIAEELKLNVDIKQSNLEGILIDILHYAQDHYDGIILNGGAYTHYSYAILDAIKSISVPVIEVHLSDTTKREKFRRRSVIRPACLTTIQGHGFKSYKLALERFKQKGELTHDS